MKLTFDRDDIIEALEAVATKILQPPPGWHAEVITELYSAAATARLVKDEDKEIER